MSDQKSTTSEQMIQNWQNPIYRKNQIDKRLGKIQWNKWITGYKTKRPEVRAKISKSVTELHKDPEYRKKYMAGRTIARKNTRFRKTQVSKMEEEIFKLINLSCPNQYIHNSRTKEILINHKRPDFINITNSKKIIEVFGHFWHSDEDEMERIDTFNKYGYDVLIIWDTEYKNKTIAELITMIKQFNGDIE